MNSSTNESYSYIEEEEVELPGSGFEPEIEWQDFGNIRIEVEPAAVKSDRKVQNARKSVKKKKLIHRKSFKKPTDVKRASKAIKISTVMSTCNEELPERNENSSGSALYEGNALFDGTFFSFVCEQYVQDETKETVTRKFKGKCELCDSPTYIVGSGSSTYNFLRHLRRKHGEKVYESYLSYKQVKSTKSRPKDRVSVKRLASSSTNIVGVITMYVAFGSVWKQFGTPRNKRPLSSIILNDGLSERIWSDVQDFILNSSWYHERGIPYRRTFLLYGPSGCGKSSFVFALASELNFGLCVLHACDRELTDNKLNYLLNSTPENTIILLEDIDTVFLPEENLERTEQFNRLTFNGVLNCLDGVTAPQGKILFITCTDKDRLNSVFLRPGRVDVIEYFGYCSQHQIVQLFEKFCESCSSLGVEFMQEVIKFGKDVTPAQLQGFFLSHKHSDVLQLKLDIPKIWDFC